MGTIASSPRFEATVTDRYQTTIPSGVRKLLGLGKRDKLAYVIKDGVVTVEKVSTPEEPEDPMVLAFLGLIGRDIVDHPERLSPLSDDMVRRAEALVDGMDIDLEAPLADQDDRL